MKMNRSILACLTAAVVFGGSLASVKADDIFPPPWTRGQPNTTYADWTYYTDANPLQPDVGVYNPYGVPEATISGGTWSQFYMNHEGIWTLGPGGYIDNYIPNSTIYNPYKFVWTQLTWQTDNNGSPVVTVVANSQQFVSTMVESEVENGWEQSVYEAVLPFNPSSEDVIVSGSLPTTTFDVGEVVVDTICIPEPSSLALLAMGALGLLPLALRKQRPAA